MQSAKKITLIAPITEESEQVGGGSDGLENSGLITSDVTNKTDKIRSKIYDKIHRFIKIILKLARSVGYDQDLRIKLKNGKYLEKSNIVDLLTHAMSVGKVLYGENEFIELLALSGVNPELVINENVRMKLIQYLNRPKKDEGLKQPEKQNYKRKLEESDSDEKSEKNKKRRTGDPLEGMPVLKDLRDPMDSQESIATTSKSNNKKRKHSELEDISDEDIDRNRWDIPKDD